MKHGTCKHYTGSWHNENCKAGVSYRDVTTLPDEPGSAYRKPCVKLDPNNKHDRHGLKVIAETCQPGTCDKYEEPTDEEVAADEAAIQECIRKTMLTIPLSCKIKTEHDGQNWQGVEVCPVCGGKLHMSHAACNGHVWGQCETEGCVSWME